MSHNVDMPSFSENCATNAIAIRSAVQLLLLLLLSIRPRLFLRPTDTYLIIITAQLNVPVIALRLAWHFKLRRSAHPTRV